MPDQRLGHFDHRSIIVDGGVHDRRGELPGWNRIFARRVDGLHGQRF
jgi:hypothetical protein